MIWRLLKEPLLRFLVLGMTLFVAYAYFTKDDIQVDATRIVVDNGRLLTYMQTSAKQFDAGRFNKILDNLPGEELQSLIQNYVREEALYREAKAMNLDRNDIVIRRRLIQQMEYIARGFISSDITLSDAELQHYLDNHRTNYTVPDKITFTHVFFNRETLGDEVARQLAQAKLLELNEKRIPFHEAVAHGDHFLYHRNYVNKEADEISSHFGDLMQTQVFDVIPDAHIWHGPYPSPYGFHLVLVTEHSAGYIPTLEEVRGRVTRDAYEVRTQAKLEEAIESIVENYKVDITDSLKRGGSKRVPTVSEAG